MAIIGDTDVSPTVQNDQLTVGWADAMFPETVPTFGSSQPLKRLGEILNAGKAYMAAQHGPTQQLTGNVMREHLIWHLLGDPSMEMRTRRAVGVQHRRQFTTRFLHRTGIVPGRRPGVPGARHVHADRDRRDDRDAQAGHRGDRPRDDRRRRRD